MSNIELLIGQSSTEGERKRRARMELQKIPQAIADICPPEIEIKKEIDIESEKERYTGQPTPAVYGRYKNIFLTDTELEALKNELPEKWSFFVERLSEYMASKVKSYDNHAATIRRWAVSDTEKAAVEVVSTLTC